MTQRIFLLEDRIPFLIDQIPAGKVKVIEADSYGMNTVDITIEDSYDLLKLFHAGMEAGRKSLQ
jgi:hypothetical protein